MKELLLLSKELSSAKTSVLYRKDIKLYQRSLSLEAQSLARTAESEAKRRRIGHATIVVVLHDSVDPASPKFPRASI